MKNKDDITVEELLAAIRRLQEAAMKMSYTADKAGMALQKFYKIVNEVKETDGINTGSRASVENSSAEISR